MGRWSFSSKQTADGLKKVDIRWLKKQGFLCGFKSGIITWTNSWTGNKSSAGISVSTMDNYGKYIQFTYTQADRNTGEKKDFDYKIPLTVTPCNYGGKRYWFLCQLSKNGQFCDRRVGVLYKGGDYFGCRHCYELAYESNRERYHITSVPELEELEKNIKRTYYKGRMTRKYKSYLKKEERNNMGLFSLVLKLKV